MQLIAASRSFLRKLLLFQVKLGNQKLSNNDLASKKRNACQHETYRAPRHSLFFNTDWKDQTPIFTSVDNLKIWDSSLKWPHYLCNIICQITGAKPSPCACIQYPVKQLVELVACDEGFVRSGLFRADLRSNHMMQTKVAAVWLPPM